MIKLIKKLCKKIFYEDSENLCDVINLGFVKISFTKKTTWKYLEIEKKGIYIIY